MFPSPGFPPNWPPAPWCPPSAHFSPGCSPSGRFPSRSLLQTSFSLSWPMPPWLPPGWPQSPCFPPGCIPRPCLPPTHYLLSCYPLARLPPIWFPSSRPLATRLAPRKLPPSCPWPRRATLGGSHHRHPCDPTVCCPRNAHHCRTTRHCRVGADFHYAHGATHHHQGVWHCRIGAWHFWIVVDHAVTLDLLATLAPAHESYREAIGAKSTRDFAHPY